MDPVTAAILIGGGSMIMQQQMAKQQAEAMRKAQRKQEEQSARNQNKLVEQNFQKRKQALGIGQGGGEFAGGVASQEGGVLTSVTGESQNVLG